MIIYYYGRFCSPHLVIVVSLEMTVILLITIKLRKSK